MNSFCDVFKGHFSMQTNECTTILKASTIQTQKAIKGAHTEKTRRDGRAVSGVFQSCKILLQKKWAGV